MEGCSFAKKKKEFWRTVGMYHMFMIGIYELC